MKREQWFPLCHSPLNPIFFHLTAVPSAQSSAETSDFLWLSCCDLSWLPGWAVVQAGRESPPRRPAALSPCSQLSLWFWLLCKLFQTDRFHQGHLFWNFLCGTVWFLSSESGWITRHKYSFFKWVTSVFVDTFCPLNGKKMISFGPIRHFISQIWKHSLWRTVESRKSGRKKCVFTATVFYICIFFP